jgi:Flp pilus assembly protein TadG
MKMRQTKTWLRRGKARRGAVLVEFVFVMFLLIILIFGIIEVSLVMKNQATVAQAAREAARSASVGSQPNVANQRAITTATGITLHNNNVVLEKSTNNGQSWTTLQTTGSPVTNDAAVGDLVRATVTYTHSLVTGFIYSGGSKQLTSTVVMRRE